MSSLSVTVSLSPRRDAHLLSEVPTGGHPENKLDEWKGQNPVMTLGNDGYDVLGRDDPDFL